MKMTTTGQAVTMTTTGAAPTEKQQAVFDKAIDLVKKFKFNSKLSNKGPTY